MDKHASRMTPIDDNDPNCDKTDVALGIYNVDPDLVTEKLSIEPTFTSKIGVEGIMPSGARRVGRTNSWILASESWFRGVPNPVSSKDIRTHLEWLLTKLTPRCEQLLELQQIPGIKMRIICSWWSMEKDGGSFTLWPEQMEKMAQLNLECDFGISYYGDD